MAEKISGALAIFLCVILPVALGYWDAAAGGSAGLLVFWWQVKRGEDDTRAS